MKDIDRKTSSGNKGSVASKGLCEAVLAALLLLPPLIFWLTVRSGFRGGEEWLFRFWRYLPNAIYPVIIVFLPVPALIYGTLAIMHSGKVRSSVGFSMGIIALILGLLLEISLVVMVFPATI